MSHPRWHRPHHGFGRDETHFWLTRTVLGIRFDTLGHPARLAIIRTNQFRFERIGTGFDGDFDADPKTWPNGSRPRSWRRTATARLLGLGTACGLAGKYPYAGSNGNRRLVHRVAIPVSTIANRWSLRALAAASTPSAISHRCKFPHKPVLFWADWHGF